MRISNIETLKEFALRKKLTGSLVRGIRDDINDIGVFDEDKLAKAIMVRINTFLMGDGCDRLPLDLGQ